MSGKVYLLTGSNRGIGLELVKLLASKKEDTVIASARDLSNAKELTQVAKENKNVHLITLDVSSAESIANLDSQLKDVAKDGIDVFISNAAVAKCYQPALEVDRQVWIDHYVTNVVGPIEITKVLKKYLLRRKTRHLIFISSIVGSLSHFFPVSTAAYGQSKAALNHTLLTLSNELKDELFTVVAVHPGNVTSDMGVYGMGLIGGNHPETVEYLSSSKIEPAQSASDQVNNVFYKLTIEDNGKFFSYDGNEIPY